MVHFYLIRPSVGKICRDSSGRMSVNDSWPSLPCLGSKEGRIREVTNDFFTSQITESSRSCVCGHVLEDANRYIGGKRFSGIMIPYRKSNVEKFRRNPSI